MRVDRRGVTLVELLVVLALAGLVLAAASAAARGVMDASLRIESELWAIEEARVVDDLLRELLRMHAGPHPERLLRGDDSELTFESRCPVLGPGTWPCSVSLRVSSAGEVTLAWTGAAPIVVRRRREAHGLIYLDRSAEGYSWHARWDVATRSPLAVGIVAASDTALYWVGVQ